MFRFYFAYILKTWKTTTVSLWHPMYLKAIEKMFYSDLLIACLHAGSFGLQWFQISFLADVAPMSTLKYLGIILCLVLRVAHPLQKRLLLLLLFWPCHAACSISVPWLGHGIEGLESSPLGHQGTPCFSCFNVHICLLGTLLKSRFWFSRSWRGPTFWILTSSWVMPLVLLCGLYF